MLDTYLIHNQFKNDPEAFDRFDPHIVSLAQLTYQHSSDWWKQLSFEMPGIYVLTGGRQVGKSTSCKLLIKHCLHEKILASDCILYLPCDEIFTAQDLSKILRYFLESVRSKHFLLIVDEITYVKHWERVIKALADEGHFKHGICLLTGSDTLILKEAVMSFPGRRGNAAKVDFHLYPLSFGEYVNLVKPNAFTDDHQLAELFRHYLITGGYLRAINDFARENKVLEATYLTYEQWIRGDFLKQGKNDATLIAILQALLIVNVSQISFSSLTQKIGLISKETLIDYCRYLERMDLLINLQAFDQNKQQGFPRKDRKFHFTDPFIYHTLYHWLNREGYLTSEHTESALVEACVASHCHRYGKAYYFKGQGEIDVIFSHNKVVRAIEVKWAEQLRPHDLKTLKQFNNSVILTKHQHTGSIENIVSEPVYQYLYRLK